MKYLKKKIVKVDNINDIKYPNEDLVAITKDNTTKSLDIINIFDKNNTITQKGLTPFRLQTINASYANTYFTFSDGDITWYIYIKVVEGELLFNSKYYKFFLDGNMSVTGGRFIKDECFSFTTGPGIRYTTNLKGTIKGIRSTIPLDIEEVKKYLDSDYIDTNVFYLEPSLSYEEFVDIFGKNNIRAYSLTRYPDNLYFYVLKNSNIYCINYGVYARKIANPSDGSKVSIRYLNLLAASEFIKEDNPNIILRPEWTITCDDDSKSLVIHSQS